MATCLCDVFFDDVARATVEVLEHLGCAVTVPRDQTCCGQPAFNAGEWAASRRVARHTLQVFAGDTPVVTPSGSCAKMMSHGMPMLFEREDDRPLAEKLGSRAWELADFIVYGLGVSAWAGRFEAAIAFHRSCHSRGTRCGEAARQLLASIEGVTLVEFGEAEQCCGFGGTFAAGFPNISRGIGILKLDHLLGGARAPERDGEGVPSAKAPDAIVSSDMGCLMHLEGLARKEGRGAGVRMLHVAQILRDALAGTGDGRGS